MKKVLSKVIDKCQSAFVQDRHLLDSVLVANETIDEVKSHQEALMNPIRLEDLKMCVYVLLGRCCYIILHIMIQVT